jgi:transketolase
LEVAQAVDGPVYLRMLRGEVPRLFSRSEPLRLQEPRVLCSGKDLAIISSGICTEEAMRAAAALSARGLAIAHLHVSTLKPLEARALLEPIAAARYGAVVVENHSVIGGLGSALAEQMADAGIPKRLIRLGLQDQYAHGASRAYLMQKYGLDAAAVIRAVERLVGVSIPIPTEELQAVSITPPDSSAKPEEL